MSTAHRLSSSHSVAPTVVAPKRRRSSAVHAITAAVEPLERRLCLSAASLTPLGFLPGHPFSSYAYGVSGDGSVVVGGSGFPVETIEAFRWTAAGGTQALGDLPGGVPISTAYGVSGDGSVIVGYSSSASGTQAFRWTSAGGMVGLGILPGDGYSQAFGASGDASVVVGSSFSAPPSARQEAFRWTASGGMQGLGDLPGGPFRSGASGVSADGSVIVGWSTVSDDLLSDEAFRWTSGGGMVGLGDLPGGGFSSWPGGISADGSVIVGGSSSASAFWGEAFRWTSGGGMVGLGLLPGAFSTTATGVSGDGSVVVGSISWYPTTGPGTFYWTADGGMRALWDVLLSHGVNPAADGWTDLYSVGGISADGNTIVGFGERNGQPEAFVATLAVPEMVASAFQFNDLPHRIAATFDQNVSASLGTDDLLIENLTTQQTIPSSDFALAYDASTNAATFTYTGNAGGINGVLPDGNYRATLLAAGITNGSGTPMPADVTLDFFFLNGDANRDGQVNLSDFNVLAANFGQGGRDFTQGDFTYDTIVNLSDFNILASRFGQSLLPARTTVWPPPRPAAPDAGDDDDDAQA